ncbi:MAG: phosphate transporter substrate-binding protein PhoT family [Ilumatobacteraceae bacterium]|nr:phosphate transporter substrate-binding protein PhoT family [Ilumatobacteraceae bacterium]
MTAERVDGDCAQRTHPGRRVALLAGLLLVLLPTTMAGAAGSHSLIQGSGSSWSANALNQWIADVQSNGIQVVFTANGSAQGRKDFAYRTNDFAITEIGFQGTDAFTGDTDTSQGRPYAYLPIVAGGTSFPYQIKVGGQLVRDLRLSGLTLAKIFTNQITDWSDPAITADNNGRQLPSLPIIPVVHSEGSGTSAHFSDYIAEEFPDLWMTFNGAPGLTEYWPRHGNTIAQSGSEGVMNFVTSSAANGAIGYDEYSYPLGKNYPVAKIENSAGFFTLPTQYNVAVALTQANINQDPTSPDYLLQDLRNVYTDTDPRTYALSSYSYMVIPTGTAPADTKMTTSKRQTIADFLYYSICDGQREIGPIGYSPLPVNLVQAGFQQIARLHDADPNVDLTQRDVSTCHNPTFDAADLNRNRLAEIAPQPLACDQAGQPICDPNIPQPLPLDDSVLGTATTTAAAVTPTSTVATVPAANAPVTVADTVANTVTRSTAASSGGPAVINLPTASTVAAAGVPTVGSSDIATVDSVDIAAAPAVVDQVAPLGGAVSTSTSAPGSATASADAGVAPVSVVAAQPVPAGGAVAPGIQQASGDQPQHVTGSSSSGILAPVVIVLVALLLVAPAVRVRISVKRRRGAV